MTNENQRVTSKIEEANRNAEEHMAALCEMAACLLYDERVKR